MSEQFAMQPEEFESTNSRLDSILDRLNALGESAAEMKVAPLRPLQSVPDLEPAVQAAPEVPTDLVPPSVPPLGLVPPVEATTVVSPVEPVASSPVVEPQLAPEVAPQEAAVATVPDAVIEPPTAVEIAAPVAEAPDASFAPDVAPVEELAAASAPETVDVEYHDLELAAAEDVATEIAPDSTIDGASVFEMSEQAFSPAPASDAPIETPDAPGSIFGSSLGTTPSTEESVSDDAETDGWVSHAGEEATSIDDVFEAPEFAREDVAPETEVSTPDTEIAEPQWGDEQGLVDDSSHAIDAGFGVPEGDIATEVEETLGGFDAFSAMDTTEEPIAIAGIDIGVVETADSFEVTEEDHYTTDEELPLPDFTGVYNEPANDDGFWGDESALPEPVEGTSNGAIRRDELDKLRPIEEEALAEEAPSGNASLRVQFLGVLIVGALACIAMWWRDPNVFNDMLDSITNLVG